MAQMTRGQGTVFQDKNTKKWVWQGSYVDKSGKKKRPKKIFNTKEQALLFQAEQLKEQEVSKMKMTKNLTVEEMFEQFYQEWKNGRLSKKYSVNTMRCTKSHFVKHIIPQFGKRVLLKMKRDDVETFYERLMESGLNAKTIKNIHCDFKKLVKYAESKKYIYNDFLKDIKIELEKNNEVVNVLEDWEFQQIMNNEKNKEYYYYPVIKFLGETGLRAEELAFRHSDIVNMRDGVGRKIIICKSIVRDTDFSVKRKKGDTGKLVMVPRVKNTISKREVPLSLEAEGALAIWLNDPRVIDRKGKDDIVFFSTTGNYIDKDNLLRSFYTMLENCGLEKRGLHSLRKRFINHARRRGVSADDLGKITGHSVATMYNHYKQLGDEDMQIISDML